MIDTIAYIHDHQIVHRDINLRSFVLARPGDARSIRLTGFSEAWSFSEGPITAPIRWYADRFVAPEILERKPHDAVRSCVYACLNFLSSLHSGGFHVSCCTIVVG